MTGIICHSAVVYFVRERLDHISSKSEEHPLVENFTVISEFVKVNINYLPDGMPPNVAEPLRAIREHLFCTFPQPQDSGDGSGSRKED
jgi:hypothetical protein